MPIDLINEWPEANPGAQVGFPPYWPPTADAIRHALSKPAFNVAQVHCYMDEGFPWLRVMFDDILHPDTVKEIASALVQASPGCDVCFYCLRSRAVEFIFDYRGFAEETDADLDAKHYGNRADEIVNAWT